MMREMMEPGSSTTSKNVTKETATMIHSIAFNVKNQITGTLCVKSSVSERDLINVCVVILHLKTL
uniref:Uncharacterized protein n=1 Tax=Anguilla anguilla TaxID=7936 RepID=A0A0E9X7C5_ANGAN